MVHKNHINIFQNLSYLISIDVNMWGDHINIKYSQIEPVIITFKRLSKTVFVKFSNFSNVFTRTKLIFFIPLSLFNVCLG